MLLEFFNPGEICQGQPKVARSSQGSKADEESSQMSLTLTRVQTATPGSKAECCWRGWIRMSSGMKWSSLYTPLKTISVPKQLRIWAVKSRAVVLGQTQMKPGGEAPPAAFSDCYLGNWFSYVPELSASFTDLVLDGPWAQSDVSSQEGDRRHNHPQLLINTLKSQEWTYNHKRPLAQLLCWCMFFGSSSRSLFSVSCSSLLQPLGIHCSFAFLLFFWGGKDFLKINLIGG